MYISNEGWWGRTKKEQETEVVHTPSKQPLQKRHPITKVNFVSGFCFYTAGLKYMKKAIQLKAILANLPAPNTHKMA